MEKSLPLNTTRVPPSRPASYGSFLRVAGVVLISLFLLFTWSNRKLSDLVPGSSASPKCPQAPAIFPSTEHPGVNRMYDFLSTTEFANASAKRLSAAVQVRTESFDDLGPIGEDPRWDVFFGFADYLEKTFPRIRSQLKLEKINTHGLLYTWDGKNSELKPTLLMAHQDVVPVPDDTVDSWTYPPFSGFFDGKKIWGRGASDCKNSLLAIMETVELLLEAEFEPDRTVIISLGFDEESSGLQGAGSLASFLLDRYGKNGIEVIVDEGLGYEEAFGMGFVVPGVAEKGYTDVEIAVHTPGGHSSIPRDHTSIGILSELITEIEAHQYEPYLTSQNPFLEYLQCGARYAPEFPKKLRKLLDHHRDPKTTCAKKRDHLAREASKLSAEAKYLMQTSQAVDIIRGGVKVNAMPESARATVNHRINIGDEPETVYDHLRRLAKPVAKKFNLTLHAFDGKPNAPNSISLSARDNTLRVAPVTPTRVDVVSPYAVLAGTIRALHGESTVVAPALMSGNTDTRYYWDLSRHIVRFGPGYVNEPMEGLGNVHTVDEFVTLSNHIKAVQFFTVFIRNMDESQVEN